MAENDQSFDAGKEKQHRGAGLLCHAVQAQWVVACSASSHARRGEVLMKKGMEEKHRI